MLVLDRKTVSLSLWSYLFLSYLTACAASFPYNAWGEVIFRESLFVLLAFLAIFHLLTTQVAKSSADRWDFVLFFGVVFIGFFTSMLGLPYDVPVLMGIVGFVYLLRRKSHADNYFFSCIYIALLANGFIAPLIFHLLKPFILMSEIQFAAILASLYGVDVSVQGVILSAVDTGMRIKMVGACSVFSNLSLAILGFVSIKAFFRLRLKPSDFFIILAMALTLILANGFRISMMVKSMDSYEYWHNGNGASMFSAIQFILIVAVSVFALFNWKKA